MSDARTRWVGSCGIRWYDGGEANLSLVFLVASIWIPAATGSTALLQPSTDSAKAHCAAILTYTLRDQTFLSLPYFQLSKYHHEVHFLCLPRTCGFRQCLHTARFLRGRSQLLHFFGCFQEGFGGRSNDD